MRAAVISSLLLALAVPATAAPSQRKCLPHPPQPQPASPEETIATFEPSPIHFTAETTLQAPPVEETTLPVDQLIVDASPTVTSVSEEPTQPPVTEQEGEVWPTVDEPGATGPESMQKALVDLHNEVRAQFSAGPVEWDQELADFAAGHSDQCIFEHSDGNNRKSGENLAAATDTTIPKLFEQWASEEQYFNWENPSMDGLGGAVGHWTQIVWKETTKIGCAWKTCADGTIFTGYGDSKYLVCEYFPPGNMVGPDFGKSIGPKA